MDDDSYLQLPTDPGKRKEEPADNPAAALIRQKVEAAYSAEPDAATEARGAQAAEPAQRTKHQQFIYELTTSGKSPVEIQMAWHDYYAALPDVEKHGVWQEFYVAQGLSPSYPSPAPQPVEKDSPSEALAKLPKNASSTMADLKQSVLSAIPKKRGQSKKSPAQSLVFGLAVGSIVVLITLFGFFNERFVAPFIQPSRSLSNVPLITDVEVGPASEIIIPKINVQIPVVYGETGIDEPTIQKTLERGVLHYADTPLPGQMGNAVIVGHSSNNIFNKGKYKFAFVLLSRLEPGDTFYLQKDGKRYTYEIYQKKVVKPNDVSVLGTADRPSTVSLITCDPPGTSINRLVVTAEQISPDPTKNAPRNSDTNRAAQTEVIPSNAQSLWARLWSTLSR